MRDFIIEQLRTLDVINDSKLLQYVDFCLVQNQDKKIVSATSHHHILPQAIFQEFVNLNENTWNGVHLNHGDHYLAHALLAQAVSNFSISKAFQGMHNKEVPLRNISNNILVNAEIYQELKERDSKLMSEWQNEIMEDGRTRAQQCADKQWETKRKNGTMGDASQMRTPEAIAKRIETVNTIQKSGLTRAQEIGLKGSETKRKNPEKYSGENNPFFGKKHTEETKQKLRKPKSNTENMKKSNETRQKIGDAQRGVPKSEEAKANMRKAKALESIRICPHCGKKGKGGNMTRYHFDNCKKLNKNIL